MIRNLKFALRMLLKTPFVTGIAILSLALGIGANAAIYSLYDHVLTRALPVRAPEELVNLSAPGPKPGSTSCNQAGSCDDVFSYPMFRDLERVQKVLTGLAAHRSFGANLSYRGQTLSGEGMLVSGAYFRVLGVTPALGRLLTSGDDAKQGESHVTVLSYDYWQSRFGGRPDVLNQVLTVNGQQLTVVGVAGRGFNGTTLGSRPQVFVPITLRGEMEPGFKDFANRRTYWTYVFGRLRPQVGLTQAAASLNVSYRAILQDVEAPLQEGMSKTTMARFRARQVALTPGPRGQNSMADDARVPLTILLGVTALVLVIACANIANLLLARAAARSTEMAVRLSLGGSRWQLIGQLLTESLLLAAAGGIAGLAVGYWTLRAIVSLLPTDTAASVSLSIDTPVLAFAAALTMGTGLLFGLFPALHSTRPDLVSTLKGQSGQPSGTRTAARFRTSLATAQIALSMALLVGAGLFTRSLLNVSRVDLGLNIDRLVTFSISPELNGYTDARSRVLFEQVEERLSTLPRVTAVTASFVPALGGSNWGTDVAVEGFKTGPDVDSNARFNYVGAGYFRAMGIPLIAGREFTRADREARPKVAIVNEEFTKRFNLGRNAVGKRIGIGPKKVLDIEIVGVVQNAKYSEVKGKIPPLFFLPYTQDELGAMSFYARTSGDPERLLAAIPRVIAQLDPNLPVEHPRTMTQQVAENVFLDRFISVLSMAFACLATLLAAIGLYGVLAYSIAQRTREIGLRMALGAEPSRVRRMVLRQVAVMTLVGGTVGLLASVWLGHLAQSVLFELQGHDPMVLVSSAALLTAVALGAGFIPALRASRVEPMTALRYE